MKAAAKPRPAARSLADDVAAFLAQGEAKGLSPRTLRWGYGFPLQKVLLPFCQQRGMKSAAQLDQAAVDALARELHARDLAPASVRSYLNSIRVFLKWTKETDARPHLPRLRKVELDVLTLKEMRALEEGCPTLRDQLIIRLLADTGMREGELASIRLSDIRESGDGYFIRIRGKTGERMVSISETLHDRLKRFIRTRPKEVASDRLFLGLQRRPSGSYEPLTGSGIYQVVTNAAARLKWKRRVYAHLLRHSNITLRAAAGQHPATISAETGASQAIIASTYTHPALRDRHASTMRVLRDEEP